MSVKTDYEDMKLAQSRIMEALKDKKEAFSSLQKDYDKLTKRKEELSRRSSRLAVPLLKEVSDEIVEVESKISQVNEDILNFTLALNELDEKFGMLYDDATPYVEEQSDLMVKKLLDFVSKNEMELASNIRNCFTIGLETEPRPYRSSSYEVPTGNLVITQESQEIATSKDFYFDKYLYETSIDVYCCIVVSYTIWFEEYLKLFRATLKSKIMEAFKEHKDFKVSFLEDSQFILELI